MASCAQALNPDCVDSSDRSGFLGCHLARYNSSTGIYSMKRARRLVVGMRRVCGRCKSSFFGCFRSVFATLASLFLARDLTCVLHFRLFSFLDFLTPCVRFPGFLHVLHFAFCFWVCLFAFYGFGDFSCFRRFDFVFSWPLLLRFVFFRRFFCVSCLRLLGLCFVDRPRSARGFF